MSTAFVTLLVALAVLGITLCTAATGAFLAAPPTGDRAMGLVPFLIAAIAAAVALALAAIVRAALGQFAWVHPSPWAAAAIALPLALGVSVCLFAGFLLWAEGPKGSRALGLTLPLLALLGHVLGPLTLGAVLIFSPKLAPGDLTRLPLLTGCAALLALLGAAGLVATAFASASISANLARVARQPPWTAARGNGPTPTHGDLKSFLAQAGPETDLLAIITWLPLINSSASRALIVQRAAQAPRLADRTVELLTDRQPRFRAAAATLVAEIDPAVRAAHAPLWGPALARSIAITTQHMGLRPRWPEEHFPESPDPLGMLTALTAAASALGNPPPVVSELHNTLAVLEERSDSSAKSRAVAILQAWARHAPAPAPAPAPPVHTSPASPASPPALR